LPKNSGFQIGEMSLKDGAGEALEERPVSGEEQPSSLKERS
jgi:hypothetical protein